MRLRISARKSDLARLQAYQVGESLEKAHQGLKIEYQFKESLGDKNLTDPLWKMPEKGVFTEDFYQELLTDKTDLVVHSWKDLPTEGKPDTEIVATLPRADQRDLLLIKKKFLDNGNGKNTQQHELNLFSSSPRRVYNLSGFLLEALPVPIKQVNFTSVRGNIPTRLRKLIEAQNIDGIVMAKAAIDRLLSAQQSEFQSVQAEIREVLSACQWMVLPLQVNPNAAAQGALAIEIHKSRSDVKKLVQQINHRETFTAAQKERDLLASYGGGCHQKIGTAVLLRSYGVVQICKGQTDQGQILNQCEVFPESGVPEKRFPAVELWPPPGTQEPRLLVRQSREFKGWPADAQALFVAKADAWPENGKFNKIVWTAGISTWKKLAKMGIWVNGSAEGLGESEAIDIEALANGPLKWYKLTHAEGPLASEKNQICTYDLIWSLDDPFTQKAFRQSLLGKKCFFWGSGSLFAKALEVAPEIASAVHACGLGHTRTVIEQSLRDLDQWQPGKLRVFLSQREWRDKCQK